MAPVLRHCPCLRPENDDVRTLDYSHSNLDDVPNEVFGFERTLEELYLDANQIKDLPRPLFHCHGLRKLNLSDNEVQTLPPAVASLINLEQLDISKNGVLEIPDNIKGCKCLSMIDASVNPLGKLPEGFTQLINLQELYLNDTFLEYLPANFGRLCRLKILELRENHLKVLPKSMARLTELSRLDIGQNDFVDLPEVIGNLPRLVELWCDCNNLSCLPPFLGGLKKLAYLDASKNRIYEVADEIEGCSSLCDLTLSSNRIKILPEGIANLRKMTVLRVDENRLITLPVNIGNLCNLEELVLSSNDLSKLPFTIGLLRSLRTLIADDNLLEELPCEMGSCLKLTILSLRDNKLVHIPDELGHITALKVINLSGNLLQYLPFSIAKLPNLQALWLSENQNKPLIPLQSDTDKITGQKVLTCFMLPQVPLEEGGPHEVERAETDSAVEGKARHLIKFAFDIEKDQPSKLIRAPTPYPKELKAHARHARNYALKKQGSKDSEGNEIVDQNPQPSHNKGDVLHATGATPDIMVVLPPGPIPESRAKVKEAVVTNPKSPPASPPRPEKIQHQNHKDKPINKISDLQQQSSVDQNTHMVNLHASLDISTAEVPFKALGRRDSRGDGSSSENTSTSPAGSPKSTVDNTQVEDQGPNPRDGRFKKNSSATGSKRDTWMRQRLLRQGSGDSDRGYRSDHEIYLAERDQYGQYYAHHDGYASDWEAFLAKQNYAGNNEALPMVHQYVRPPSSSELGYRGNAEGQEIQNDVHRTYWPGFQYAERPEDSHPSDQYHEMVLNQQGYWQADPSIAQFYPPYDPNQPYQPATEENKAYFYPRDGRVEVVPVQSQSYYEPGYPPLSQSPMWSQNHTGVISRTLPKRLSGSSPRLKRAQCLSVQAPLHSTPQEYHLMPQAPGNVRHPSPGSSPRPGRSPSPRMEGRVVYPPQPMPKYIPQNPHLQQYAFPITSQPINPIQFPPPQQPMHPPYYGPYHDPPPTYPPMPPSPRLKHIAQPYMTGMDEPSLQQRSYGTLPPPGLHNSSYYNPGRLQPNNQGEGTELSMGSMNPYSMEPRNIHNDDNYGPRGAEYVGSTPSNLQYRSGSIPMEMQNLDYEGSPVNQAQYLNRSVPCINIIPSTSPPQTSYMSSNSVEQALNEMWKGDTAKELPRNISHTQEPSPQNLTQTEPTSTGNTQNQVDDKDQTSDYSNLPTSKLKNVASELNSVSSKNLRDQPLHANDPESMCITSTTEHKPPLNQLPNTTTELPIIADNSKNVSNFAERNNNLPQAQNPNLSTSTNMGNPYPSSSPALAQNVNLQLDQNNQADPHNNIGQQFVPHRQGYYQALPLRNDFKSVTESSVPLPTSKKHTSGEAKLAECNQTFPSPSKKADSKIMQSNSVETSYVKVAVPSSDQSSFKSERVTNELEQSLDPEYHDYQNIAQKPDATCVVGNHSFQNVQQSFDVGNKNYPHASTDFDITKRNSFPGSANRNPIPNPDGENTERRNVHSVAMSENNVHMHQEHHNVNVIAQVADSKNGPLVSSENKQIHSSNVPNNRHIPTENTTDSQSKLPLVPNKEQLDGKKPNSVSIMAEAINNREKHSQHFSKSSAKPGYPVQVSSSQSGYLVSSLDTVISHPSRLSGGNADPVTHDPTFGFKNSHSKTPTQNLSAESNQFSQGMMEGIGPPAQMANSSYRLNTSIIGKNSKNIQNSVNISSVNTSVNPAYISSNRMQDQKVQSPKKMNDPRSTIEIPKAAAPDKRFQKVLPPFDKTHQLKPSSARNSSKESVDALSISDADKQKGITPDVTQVDQVHYAKEFPQNVAVAQHAVCNTVLEGNSGNPPPHLPPKPNYASPLTTNEENSPQGKLQPSVPPKPNSTTISTPDVPPHSKRSSNKIANVTQHLINAINRNTATELTNKDSRPKENMPDLLSRIEPEKCQLILEEVKKGSFKDNLKSEEKVLNNKLNLSSKIVSPDQEKNFVNETEENVPHSPKSPKRNSWFFGTHKNTLVFPVVILKNPGLGFTIEGGIGSPKNPNRPNDNGIYVAHVVANGPASTALRPGDKILQANGIDFARLHIEKAAGVLQCKESTVSLLVSRE